jgi:hypothetical protein
MNQPSRPEDEQAQPKSGVTAVLDSLIRDTEAIERQSEEPLNRHRSKSALMSESELLDLRREALAETGVRHEPRPEPAAATARPVASPQPVEPPSGTAATKPARMPDMPTRIAFSDHAQLGRTMWSLAAVTALGVPQSILERVDGLTDGDDAQWLGALVKIIAPMCRGLADQPSMIVSNGPSQLAEALGLDVHELGDLPPYGGSIFCVGDGSEAALDWLRRVHGDRALHLLIDDLDAAANLPVGIPTAVSYSNRLGAIGALRVADATGATIAFGVNGDGMPIRATALEIALAIRAQLRTST